MKYGSKVRIIFTEKKIIRNQPLFSFRQLHKKLILPLKFLVYLRPLEVIFFDLSLYKMLKNRPLLSILIIALLVRLIAVFFSKGYSMHDDHFLVIEAAQSWVEGRDDMRFFSKTDADDNNGRSFVYAGMHYYLFKALESFSIYDPQAKMYVVRFLHALFSLLTIYFGYKIVRKLSGPETAKQVGLLLALLWLFPPMSVRNLIEMVAIPFLMAAVWYVLISDDENKSQKKYALLLAAGILTGIAFPIRYQTLFFTGGISIVLLLKGKLKESIVYSIGMMASIGLLSGFLEWLVWDAPFGKLIWYIDYNIKHAQDYSTQPWYTFILQVLIIFLPPISLFVFFGQFNVYKKYFLVFIPTLLFFVFHSYFPNKQERFIFTILPFMLMMGIAGWNEFYASSAFWQKHKKFVSGAWIFFWIVNTILLSVFIFSYSKKSRTEAVYYFHDKKVEGILLEHTETYRTYFLPLFYANHKWPHIVDMNKNQTLEGLKAEIDTIPVGSKPDYVLFLDETNLSQRVERLKVLYPELHIVEVAKPSLLDWILYKMNPVNVNQVVYIGKTTH